MTELRKKWREAVDDWWKGKAQWIPPTLPTELTTTNKEPLERFALNLQSLADEERREAEEAARIASTEDERKRSGWASELRTYAQNEMMIDGHFFPSGVIMNEIADYLCSPPTPQASTPKPQCNVPDCPHDGDSLCAALPTSPASTVEREAATEKEILDEWWDEVGIDSYDLRMQVEELIRRIAGASRRRVTDEELKDIVAEYKVPDILLQVMNNHLGGNPFPAGEGLWWSEDSVLEVAKTVRDACEGRKG